MISTEAYKIILQTLEYYKDAGNSIVFANGCFDIIHAGHIKLFEKAKHSGDILVIGLNSDASVTQLKGASRPVNEWYDRAAVLQSIRYVDYVIGFEEPTPERIIKDIRPDVILKGGDWKTEDVVGKEFVESYGGKVMIVPVVEGVSTTSIVGKVDKEIEAANSQLSFQFKDASIFSEQRYPEEPIPINPATGKPYFTISDTGFPDNWNYCEPNSPRQKGRFDVKGKTFCFDIDGVIAKTLVESDYTQSEPVLSVIRMINWLFGKGAYIKLYTARGGNSGKDWDVFTREQMHKWGVRYNSLFSNKPSADFYIDDKMIGLEQLMDLVESE